MLKYNFFSNTSTKHLITAVYPGVWMLVVQLGREASHHLTPDLPGSCKYLKPHLLFGCLWFNSWQFFHDTRQCYACWYFSYNGLCPFHDKCAVYFTGFAKQLSGSKASLTLLIWKASEPIMKKLNVFANSVTYPALSVNRLSNFIQFLHWPLLDLSS